MLILVVGSASVVVTLGLLWRFARRPHVILSSYNIPIASGGKYFVGHLFEGAKYENVGAYDIKLFKELGPTFGVVEFDAPVIVTKDLNLMKEILFNHLNVFSARRKMYLRSWSRYSLIDLDGVEWKRVRALLTPFFSTSKLKNSLSLVSTCCVTFVDHLEKMSFQQESIDVQSLCGAFTLDMICSSAFGLQVDSQTDDNNEFLSLLRKLTNFTVDVPRMFICFTFPFVSPILEFFGMSMYPRGYLSYFERMTKRLLEDRLKNPNERRDFMEAMVKAHLEDAEDKSRGRKGEERKGLTHEEILANSLLFVQAGYDTTSRTLTLMMYCLAVYPQVQERVYEEMREVIGDQEITYDNLNRLEYLDMCMNEVLRCYPPLFRFDRRATEDVVINNDLHIKKGTLAVIPVWAIHHDPDIYSDPDTFDPERFSREACATRNPLYHLPFGAGLRNCIGMRLAMMVMKMALVNVMKKFKFIRTDKTEFPLKMKKYALLVHWDNNIHIGLQRRV